MGEVLFSLVIGVAIGAMVHLVAPSQRDAWGIFIKMFGFLLAAAAFGVAVPTALDLFAGSRVETFDGWGTKPPAYVLVISGMLAGWVAAGGAVTAVKGWRPVPTRQGTMAVAPQLHLSEQPSAEPVAAVDRGRKVGPGH